MVADIAVAGARITAVQPDLGVKGADEIDASGLHIFPGGIDSHVHFNEPGRTDWETISSGSAALAAGGYSTFVDMPLNNLPVTIDGPAFDLKLEAATRSSLVDFGFWGGLVPGNLDRLDDLHKRGIVLRSIDAGGMRLSASFAVFQTLLNEPSTVFLCGRYYDRVIDDAGRMRFAERVCVADGTLVPTSLIFPL